MGATVVICGVELSGALAEEARRTVLELSYDDIMELFKSKVLPVRAYGAVRIIPRNLELIREALAAWLMSGGRDRELLFVLRSAGFTMRFTCVLSVAALTDGFKSLTSAFGEARMLLSMLADPREEVSAFAKKEIVSRGDRGFAPPPGSRFEARLCFEEVFLPFSRVIRNLFPDADEIAKKHAGKMEAELRREIAKLNGQLEKRKSVGEKLSEVRRNLAAAERELSGLRMSLKNAESRIKEASDLQEKLYEQIRAEQRRADDAERRAEDLFNKRFEDFVARTEPSRSPEAKRTYDGSVRDSSDNWVSAEDALCSICPSSSGPVSPSKDDSPPVEKAHRAAQMMARKPPEQIHSGGRSTGRQSNFEYRIGEIWDGGGNVREEDRVSGSAGEEDARPQDAAPAEKDGVRGNELREWLDSNMPESGGSGLNDVLFKLITDKDPGFCALARRFGYTMLVDGHNLIEQKPSRYSDVSLSHEDKRSLLASDMETLGKRIGNVEIRLYFDGMDTREFIYSSGLRVLFSGGMGEHRADARITGDFCFRVKEFPESPLMVVSSDAGIRNECREGVYALIRAEDMAAFISKHIRRRGHV